MTFVSPKHSLAWLILGFLLVGVLSAYAQDRETVGAILDRRVEDFLVEGQEARLVLEGIGAGYRFPVVVEPEVKGTVTFEVHNATVRTVLEAICQPKGWSYEVSDRGYLLVRRFVTRIYPVDYLQMTQTGSSSASINLSESAGGGVGGFQGTAAGATGALAGGATAAANAINPLAAANSASGGSSTLSVSQQND